MRLHVVVPAALLLAALLLGGQAWLGRAERQHPLIGEAPPAFALPGLAAGRPGLASADLPGGSAVVVLFASWCPICAADMPALNALKRQGVLIHGIAVRDAPAATLGFLAKHGDPFARVGVDRGGHMLRAFAATGVPETFVVDAQGVVRFRHAGLLTPADAARLRAALE